MAIFSCKKKQGQHLFISLPSSQTGIRFNNTIDEQKFSRGAMNEFGYMGGGAGIGDFNNDGLKDIFFCGNQVSSKLYLNKDNNNFEDITNTAGLQTNVWATGVSIVDINNDGYDDLYVCCYGKGLDTRAPNLLFINQRNNTFKEEAQSYNLADTSYSTQASFFDYDKDGDLDMFLVNYNLNTSYSANNIFPKDLSGHSLANDRLYRNDGTGNKTGHPGFNNRYHVNANEPMKLFAKDIDGNGSLDPVLFYFIKDKDGKKQLYPSIGRDALAEQVPQVKKRFLSYNSYVHATADDIFKNKEDLMEFTCDETASCWLENNGKGKFIKHILPMQAQFAPINSIICNDMDGDGIKDILIAGNEYQTVVTTGRYDASYGLFLKGNMQKTFSPVSPVISGFMV